MLRLVDAIPSIIGPRGKPGCARKHPAKLHADKAYDNQYLRAALRADRIGVRIARRGIESSQRLGRHRWVIERTLSWLMNYRRLVRRYERTPEHFLAIADIACTLTCYKHLTK